MEHSAIRLRLAFIDPGLRKAPFLLELRNWLTPNVESLYWSQRPIVRRYMRSASVAMHPRDGSRTSGSADISDAELRRAIGDKEWALRPAKALRKARRLLVELAGFIDSERISAIFVWNGSNLRGALAVYLARQRGIPVIYAEHGYLSGTTQLDLEGVNAASSITRLARAGAARLPCDLALDATLDKEIARFKSGENMRGVDSMPPPELRRDIVARLASRVGFWLERRALPYINRLSVPGARADPLPERYVLLPFQVRSDSQLVLHSPLYGDDLESLVRDLDHALARIDPDLRLVAKFHPYELPQVQWAYRHLPKRYRRVSFVSGGRMARLVEGASAVVTINSTAGFEALLYNKPVLALGRNFYTVPDIVECAHRRDDLEAAMRRMLTVTPDLGARRAFLRFVQARFLVAGGYHDLSQRSLLAVATRILELLTVTPESAAPAPATGSRADAGVVDKAAVGSGQLVDA
jgi:capsular polysaccharide export protein